MFERIKKLFPFAALLICICVAGCSGPDKDTGFLPDGMVLPPDKVVDRLFSSFQFMKLEGAEKFFSEQIPEKAAKKVIQSFYDERAVGQIKAIPLKELDDSVTEAIVTFAYNYRVKDEKGYPGRDKVVEKIEVTLLKEKGEWKIRLLGIPEYDDMIEEAVFVDCMNTVMDATIAQEQLRRSRPQYAANISALLKVYPEMNELACKELTIQGAATDTFFIVAKTKNYDECSIVANTDKHEPQNFEDCAGMGLPQMPLPVPGDDTVKNPDEEPSGADAAPDPNPIQE